MPRILCTTVHAATQDPSYATDERPTCCVAVWAARAVVPRCDTGGTTVVGEDGAGACYPPSSSSNAFASWRSAVSKPSVNQP